MDSQHVAPKRRLLPPPPPPCEAHLAQPEESSTFHTFHIPIQFTGGRQRMQKIEGRPNNIDRWIDGWDGWMDGQKDVEWTVPSTTPPRHRQRHRHTPTHLPRAVHYVYVYAYVYIFIFIFIFMLMDNSIKRRKTTVYIYPRWLHRGTGERARVGCRRLRDR